MISAAKLQSVPKDSCKLAISSSAKCAKGPCWGVAPYHSILPGWWRSSPKANNVQSVLPSIWRTTSRCWCPEKVASNISMCSMRSRYWRLVSVSSHRQSSKASGNCSVSTSNLISCATYSAWRGPYSCLQWGGILKDGIVWTANGEARSHQVVGILPTSIGAESSSMMAASTRQKNLGRFACTL